METTHTENSWLKVQKVYHKCPKCKPGYLDTRVPRDPFVKYVFFWLKVRKYRCNNCQRKMYIWV